MIIEFYENPNKPKYSPPAVVANSGNGYLEHQANQRGITVEEFIRRDDMVRKEAMKATYFVGETVFPYNKKEFERLGKCRILAINRKYVELGKDYKWDEEKPLFVVSAAAEKNNYATFLATAGFFTKIEPTE